MRSLIGLGASIIFSGLGGCGKGAAPTPAPPAPAAAPVAAKGPGAPAPPLTSRNFVITDYSAAVGQTAGAPGAEPAPGAAPAPALPRAAKIKP